jgi:hypothetical protein
VPTNVTERYLAHGSSLWNAPSRRSTQFPE